MASNAGIGQQRQKQIGQTGIPVYTGQRTCHRRATALRTTIMAVKSGAVDMGLAVGVEKLAGAGLLGAGGRPKSDKNEVEPQRPLRRRHQHRRPWHRQHARRVRASGHGVRHKYGGTSFELFAKISERRTTRQHPQPVGGVHQADDPSTRS